MAQRVVGVGGGGVVVAGRAGHYVALRHHLPERVAEHLREVPFFIQRFLHGQLARRRHLKRRRAGQAGRLTRVGVLPQRHLLGRGAGTHASAPLHGMAREGGSAGSIALNLPRRAD